MNNLDSILKSYKSLVEETNQLGVLHEIQINFLIFMTTKFMNYAEEMLKHFNQAN